MTLGELGDTINRLRTVHGDDIEVAVRVSEHLIVTGRDSAPGTIYRVFQLPASIAIRQVRLSEKLISIVV